MPILEFFNHISKQNITITATFTSEPIEESLSFWLEEIGIPYSIKFAPYNQVFQELLNPTSLLANNQNGVNIVLIRFEDWVGTNNRLQLTVDDAQKEQILENRLYQVRQNLTQLEQTVKDFSSALKTATMRAAENRNTSAERFACSSAGLRPAALTLSQNPYLVCICPPSPTTDTASDILHERMQDFLADDLKNVSGVYLLKSQELTSTYAVKEYYNPHGDELGHIPYTPAFFCALGTMLARKIFALKSSPYKVIALDCDYTLWSGICGEDGVAGVKIAPPFRSLQEFIVRQQAAGKLICLCSKNQEEDVFAVFDRHQDMVLKRHHLVNWRINWQPKSENLKALADELQLSLDSFIFIDDNPVECAEVRANCPEVLTLQLPQEYDRIPQFLEHIWAFDQLQTTQEDQQRTNFYQQNVQRQRLQQDSLSFTDFLAQLNLDIKISPMQPDQLSRVAQLTQRTNQFNLTTIRRSEAEIQQLCNLGRLECRVVQVKDRFGDYGLVGLLLFEDREDALVIDTFLLSCRVLGRGVEHRMLAYLGTLAREKGLSRVDVCYTPTKKNQPAWNFLTSVGKQFQQQNDEGWIFKFPSQTASKCDLILISDRNTVYKESDREAQSTSERSILPISNRAAVANKSDRDTNDASKRSEKITSPADFFERIARNLYSPELILKEIAQRRQRQRPELDIEFVAPRTPIEQAIANLFAEILNLDKVGINDNFFELGGDSIRGAILINKLQAQLNEIVHFVVLFDTQTVAGLAAYIKEHYPQASAKLLGEEIASTCDFPQERIDEAKVEQMRSLIPTLAPPIDDDGIKNPPAIFILSPYRSGSTLLRVILGGHPQLFAPPELELLSFNTLRERKAAFSGRYSFWLEGTIRAIVQIRECSTQEAIALMEELEAKNITTKQFYQLIQQWLGDKTLVDKTPSYSSDLETLKRAERNFQNPLYIHLVRHPYATIRSYEEARLEQVVPYQHPFNRRELAELVWLISHQNILEFLQQVPQERQYQIRFENLVSQPQTSVEKICQFLGLEFHPEMLQPYNEKKQRMTDGIYTQSRMVGDVKFHEHQGINASTAESWKQYYTVDFLNDVAWQVAESLGYEKSGIAKTLTTNGVIPLKEAEEGRQEVGGSVPCGKLTQQTGIQTPPEREPVNFVHRGLDILTPKSREQRTKAFLLPPASSPLPFLVNRENPTASQTFPLSLAQTRLWFLEQLQPNSALYTIPRALTLNGILNYDALKLALNQIVARHESLRTTFVTQDGTPMQVIASNKTVELPVIDLSQLTEPEKQASVEHHLKQQAVCPFDLSRDLMLRSSLLRLSDSQHILILVMHHIASDGWSMGIFLQELAALYNANVTGVTCSLPELPIQYADYAHWQRQWLQGQQLETQLAYWKQQLQGIPPLLKLPTDRVRPAIQTFTGATESVVLPASLTQALKTLSQQEGVTLFMTLLAAFKTLLHRYTGQSDIVVGSPIAGRHQSQIEGLIGFFVNTLVLRTRFQDNLTFRELLAQVRSVALEAYAHQDLPFEKLVEELQPDRSLSHTPLFQVWFNMLNLGEKQLELSGLTVEQLPISSPVSKFDLTLYVREKQEEIKLEWVYNQDLFNPETIAWMSVHFQTLLEAIVANPGQVIANFPLLSETERQRLHNCKNSVRPNKPFTEFSKAAIEQSISARFEEQVRNYPHNIAIHSKNHLWTYSSLNQKANALAHTLQQRCPDASQRVALLLEHDAPAIAAILGVLKAGKTYVPLDPTYPQSRLTYILEDTQAIAILTNHKNLALARALTSGTLQLINIDEIDLEQTENDANRAIPPDTLAYILYTSGSTGQPKGVIQNHRNVLHFIRNYTNTLHIAADDRLTLLASYSFDAAVIDIFAALLNGATLYPIDIKSEGLTNLADWLRQQEITIYHSTPTVYRHFLETLPLPIKESEAPFPRIRLVVLGGEEVVRNDIELYQKYFSQNCIFVNGLGSTESSFNLHYLIDRQTVIFSPRVPVGYPFEDTEIALLTEAGANAEVYGEIAIRSPYIALGYWQNSQLTQAVFLPDPEAGNRRIYRTGDVGRLRADGTIEFLGRKDFQVKIRGFRIELGEIEANLAQHPAVRETVVMASPDSSGDKSLVAYVVLHHKSTATVLELRRFLKQKLPDYMMPSEWVLLGQLPLTPNGKIDRLALGAISPTRTTAQTFVPPRTPIEEILVNIWTEVLRVEAIGIHENFFELGGHSLKATRVTSRIRQAFGIELAIACLFEYPTIGSLAEHLEPLVHSQPGQKIPPIESAPRSSHLPLSFAQTRLWFLEQLQPNSALYHIPRALQLNGTLNYEALKLALNQIVARHESLRTTFVTQDGTPMQVIASNKTVELPVIDLSQLTEPEKQASVEHHLKQQTVCPFDLSRDLMLRSSLLRLSDSQHILMLVMHHIASDGWSMGIFLQELAALYNANVTGVTCSLPELPIQYADYAHWQRQWLSSQVLDHQLNYWKQQLADAPPLLELPTDRVRPAIQTFNGATKNARLPAALTQALKTLSQQEGVTLFMTLLAAFNILLHRYSGQSDIVVGSPIAGRNQIETEGLIGFFVNTLALRTRFQGNPTFRDVLNQVRSVALGAYAHQDLPFEKLVEQLQTERDLSRTPVFQVMFSLQIAPQGRFELQNIALTPLEIGNFTAKLDLILSLRETETGLQGRWDYNTDLFDGATIERMMGNFETLLEGIVAHPDRNIGELPLLTLRERHQLLVEWNNTSREYPLNKCIHQLFEEQVERTPDRIAAIFKNRKLTYREVNQKSNQLAYCLQEKGVGKGKYVPVLMERSLELLLSYLAIMKTGAAFVPIDPKWPVTRISEILRELNTEVFLINSNQECWEELSKWSCVVVNELELTGSQSNLNVFVNGTDSIYVMFTSGSTGKPKGAINQHRGLTNRFLNANDRYGRKNNDVFLFASNQIFDASIWQLLLPLVNGNCTVIAPPSLGFDLPKIIDLIEKFQVTIAGFVPSIFNLLVERLEQQPKFRQRLQSLRLLIIGGEAINPKAIYRFKSYLPGVEITNGYGPTETSISVIFYDIPSVFTEPIPIGKPLFNVQALILDENLNLVPIGVPGELYIGGVCVGLGYLNNEAATSRAFIPNPFPEIKSDRLYKTGDLVRYLPDGNIEFLGRIDRQVKIRGIRIELGEIEATLAQHPDLREAVVTVREDTPANKRLVAYVVPNASQPTIAQLRSFLKTKLPDYMVPSAFMALERMPLTPNGKINRYALPVPDTSHLSPETDAIAPRNTLELQLAQIWSEVLNIPGVGVRDNFFDLGGHSLLAVRLMACIEQQLGTYLPLATLFTEPTIEHQASLLSAATDAQRSSPLVPIRKTGSLPPLFCVHPIGGDVLCYATLARHLGETQPFWALRSLGLDGECQPLTRIEEMAATYIKALQTIQPSGPYHLAGWSMGGIVAFEMATQLVASGHDVSLLAAIDSDAPLQTFPESLLIDEAMLLVDWVKNLNGLSHKALSVSVEQLRRLAPQEQLPYVVEQAQQVGLLPTEMGHKQGSSLFNVFKANRLSLYSYRPQPYPGRITLFCSTEDSQGERLEPTLGWEELSTSGIDVHAIVSNHFSIVQTRRLAELLSRIIVQL